MIQCLVRKQLIHKKKLIALNIKLLKALRKRTK